MEFADVPLAVAGGDPLSRLDKLIVVIKHSDYFLEIRNL